MRSDTPADPPRLLLSLIGALRADLRDARYTAERVEELLGPVAARALRREDPVPARRVLASLSDPAATLLALFSLGSRVPASEVSRALPRLGLEGAVRLGILAIAPGADGSAGPTGDHAPTADEVACALVELAPYEAQDDRGSIHWWIASDLSELATGAALGADHVLGVGGASLTLARITPRSEVDRVLDVGCGSGIQALHAGRHAREVVAVDLSERALAFAAFNAALNEVELELRHGSLLDPVQGEQFDLIVSNPPFVITPRGLGEQERWTYRDGGLAGDTLLGELLAALPAHLAPGGTAVMLGNWERSGTEDWDAHPRRWTEPAREAGVDCWVIQREAEDPAQYAATWARDGGITPRDERWDELIQGWLADFASRDVQEIGFGYVLLHRPAAPSRPGLLRTEQVTGTGSGTLAVHLERGLRVLDQLEGLTDEQLLASRPRRAADLMERRHLVPGAWDPTLIELVQGAGFARTVPADQVLAATVGALDGTLTLGQTVAAVCALTGDDPEQARERLLPVIRELLIIGMLEP